jgi:uncharacterized membrane protein YGL010W
MNLFNFEEQLTAYGQYHFNQWNRAIHLLCVPLIFWSAMACMASKIPVLIVYDVYPINTTFIVTFLYIFYYLILEPVAAVAFAPFLLTLTYSANVFAIKSGFSIKIPLSLHLLGWTLNTLSQVLIEKRVPYILENWIHAIVFGPLFVYFEILFVIGYRPTLQKRLYDKTRAAVNTWKLSIERRCPSTISQLNLVPGTSTDTTNNLVRSQSSTENISR